jgi:hypothetical protein
MNTFKCQCHFCGKSIIRKKQSNPVAFHFCNLDCKAQYQRTKKPVTKEWLIKHYIEKKMDTTQIAHIVNRDPKSVWNWLKDFGIETRKRGDFSKNHFPKGYQSFLGKKHTEETKAKIRAISIAQGRVPYDPAVGSYMKGRKGKDTPNWQGGISPERQAFYSSPEWGIAVKEVWKRDNATCCNCGKHKSEYRAMPFDIHHIAGFRHKELRSVVSNLVLLCEPCHYWIHSRKNKEGKFMKDEVKAQVLL